MTQAFYINVNTIAIGSKGNSNVTGNKNQFQINIPNKVLPTYQTYQISLIDVRYPTVDLSEEFSAKFYNTTYALLTAPQKLVVDRYCQSVTPLIQLSIAEPMLVNGQLGSLVYKCIAGSSALEARDFHLDIPTMEQKISQKILSSFITNIQVQLVRSDNGELYPFVGDATEPPISMVMEIVPITIPFIDKALVPLNQK